MKKLILAVAMAFFSTAALAGQAGHTGYPYSMQQHDYFQSIPKQHIANESEMCELCSCKDTKDTKKAYKMNCCKEQCTTKSVGASCCLKGTCNDNSICTKSAKAKAKKIKEADPASGDKEQPRY
jgi:hypothetical protein